MKKKRLIAQSGAFTALIVSIQYYQILLLCFNIQVTAKNFIITCVVTTRIFITTLYESSVLSVQLSEMISIFYAVIDKSGASSF